MASAFPWVGAARPLLPSAFDEAAATLGCELAAIRAVADVESSNGGFRRDGSLERRFEPHHMPGSKMTWRDSMRLKQAERERMFLEAYQANPAAALAATSFGRFQIMGFNARAAGFTSPHSMTAQMADSEAAQLRGFVTLLKTWGLDRALRARDWRAFAARYNGSGQVAEYARRMEEAYRKHAGAASPVVLRVGDRGEAVTRLQRALGPGVPDDGVFGPETLDAVKAFQKRSDLPDDGVVGARTWAALEKRRPDVQPLLQEVPLDALLKGTSEAGALVGGVTAAAGAIAQMSEAIPDAAEPFLWGALGLIAIMGAGAATYRWARR